MHNLYTKLVGDLQEKKRYKQTVQRVKALPSEYATAFNEITKYLWGTSGITTIEPLVSLVDLLEEATADSKHIADITGPNVAAFADELVRGEPTYKDKQAQKLNKKIGS